MEIIEKSIDELIPYERNPRRNEEAVQYVKASIREFGFKQPIVVDIDNVIVVGHTRYLAAKELGLKKVPVLVASDLTDEQIKAYRLADNKTAEFASWDFELMDSEIDDILDIDMSEFGFFDISVDWDNVDNLSDESYAPPEKHLLKCPKCEHIDSKERFIPVPE